MSPSSATRQVGESVRRNVRRTSFALPSSASFIFSTSGFISSPTFSCCSFSSSFSAPRSRSPRATLCNGLPSNSFRNDSIHSSTRSDSSSTSTPFLRNTSRCGLFFAACQRIGGDVVDLRLLGLHARDVIGQRHGLLGRRVVRRREAHEFGDAFAIAEVFADAFLEHLAELGPECRVFVLLGVFADVGAALPASTARAWSRLRGSPSRRGFPAGFRARRSAAGRPNRRRPSRSADTCGSSCSASSMMNTRFTYSLRPLR